MTKKKIHSISERDDGALGYLVTCLCGWELRLTKPNARKVRSAITAHIRSEMQAAERRACKHH